ncbi:hypothetical protein F5Y09DRAFT_346910 [Xylaria sp. FL1042]|nr:hypothetical protein F5Y09DRAFT_346910 [Xylaria sp. FL1042]
MPLIKKIARRKAKERKLPQPPKGARRYKPDDTLNPSQVIIHWLKSFKQFDHMIRVFKRLESISGLSGLRPFIYSQDRERLEILLVYPREHFWLVIDRHSPRRRKRDIPELGLADLRQLRDTLVNDIGILCASRIAFSSDISLLRICYSKHHSRNSSFLPLLDTLDLTISAEQQDADDTTNWDELERDLVRKVDAQFQVFEFLAHLRRPVIEPPKQYDLQLDGKYALCIINANPFYFEEQSLIIQQIGRYSLDTMRSAVSMLDPLVLRQRGQTAPEDHIRWAMNAVTHVLRLSSGAEEAGTENYITLLIIIAHIRILWASVLFLTHVKVPFRGSLYQFITLTEPGVAEDYSSPEGFELVTEAFCNAREAIEILYGAGGRLTRTERYHISDRPRTIRKILPQVVIEGT